jgi:hypothetical protein
MRQPALENAIKEITQSRDEAVYKYDNFCCLVALISSFHFPKPEAEEPIDCD